MCNLREYLVHTALRASYSFTQINLLKYLQRGSRRPWALPYLRKKDSNTCVSVYSVCQWAPMQNTQHTAHSIQYTVYSIQYTAAYSLGHSPYVSRPSGRKNRQVVQDLPNHRLLRKKAKKDEEGRRRMKEDEGGRIRKKEEEEEGGRRKEKSKDGRDGRTRNEE